MAAKKTKTEVTEEAKVETSVAEDVQAEEKTVEEVAKEKAEMPSGNFKEIIETSLKKTERDGIDDLLDFMEDAGFYTAPCSGGNHLCKEGGLAEHSCNVMFTAEKLSVSLLGGKNITPEIRNSIVIASLLHDLGKIGDYDKPLYIDNILKSGKPSAAKPYKRNKDLTNVPHAIRSIKLATLFIDLTEDEEWAILTHDGLYDFMKYEIQGHETWLSMLIHWADLWSSKVIEGAGKDEGDE